MGCRQDYERKLSRQLSIDTSDEMSPLLTSEMQSRDPCSQA